MNSNFNMDAILGYSAPRKMNHTHIDNLHEFNCMKSQIIEDKEDGMLPDSSLSPSNTFGIDKNIEGFIKQKLTCDDDDKLECKRECTIVYDSFGNQYYVSNKYLMGLKEAQIFEKFPESPSKECNSTYNEVEEFVKFDNKTYNNEKEIQDNERLANIVYVSQLALIELKFQELEKELYNLDDVTISKWMNSAANLKYSDSDYFIPEEKHHSFSSLIPYDLQSNKNDELRHIRLKQIMKRYSELKRSLLKFKKKMKQQQKSSKLFNTVDFSAFENNLIPLPNYVKNQINLSSNIINSPNNPDFTSSIEDDNLSRSDYKDKSHVDYLSDVVDTNYIQHIDDENSNFVKCNTNSNSAINDEEDTETELNKSHYFKKNIFSTIQLLSKNYNGSESIPQLTYESENYRDNENFFNETRGYIDEHVISTDSDYPINRSPPTPDLRKAELDSNDISEGIRVLIVQQNYLRAGVIQLANKEDDDQKLWQVKLDGDRKCQDIVISEWQLLEQGVREVIPTSIHQLTHGARVCANWSVQLPLNLYPGTISRSKMNYYSKSNTLPIDFDDGDHKEIELEKVRLLPENFPNLHELIKTSNLAVTNFYTSDRKIRIRSPNYGKFPKSVTMDANNNGISDDDHNKKLIKPNKRKKIIVHWKLCKNNCTNRNNGETLQFVRNVDNLCVTVGDNVQLLSYSKGIYLANIIKILTKRQSSIMEIEFNWYYILSDVHDNSDLIKKLKKSKLSKLLIFQTNHSDINDVYSIIKKVEILSFENYKANYLKKNIKTELPNNCYIIAGKYNQSKSKVDFVNEDLKLYVYANDD